MSWWMSRMTTLLGCLVLTMASCSMDDGDETEDASGPITTTTRAMDCSFSNKVLFTKKGSGSVRRFMALMPVPRTNFYQQVSNVVCSDGRVVTDRNYSNKVLYVEREGFPGKEYTLQTTFDVKTNKVFVDVSRIKEILPYDPASEPCKRHLGDRGAYVITSHPWVVKVGDELWQQSSDVLDYARRCYEYVASHFRYIHGSDRTLDQILKEGGGECGDFSTVVVNLLRYKGIPSRHNLCLMLKGGYHVWVDFYLEGYGWIPLDATYKNGNPSGNYFGTYDGQCLIMMQDLCYDTDIDAFRGCDLLQTYDYWYESYDGNCDISSGHYFGIVNKSAQ